MKNYDVIIVGGGPAGLNCAYELSKSNKKVLLLEQNKEIGSKVCAGGLTRKSINHLGLPKNMIDCSFRRVVINTPSRKKIVRSDNVIINTIDRARLGRWQLKRLKKKNVDIRTNAKVTEIKEKCIMVNNTEKIGFKFLVGADGSCSIVRRFLGINNEKVGVGMQYIIPTEDYKEIEIFLDYKIFRTWYAWIFPHKGYVSIGCGADPNALPIDRLKRNFDLWLKKKNIDVSKAKFESALINLGYEGYRFGGMFLIGDAAGLASELTGEGIYEALVSGEEVAKEIIDKNYIPKKLDQLVKNKKRHNRITKWLELFGKRGEILYRLGFLLLKIKPMRKVLSEWV